MEYGIICAGFGGQGILSLGKFIVYGGMAEGKHVTWLPSYGPEMRGGTANCTVVMSDEEVASPLVASPDCLVAMNRPSLDKFAPRVKPGGIILVNSSLIDVKVQRDDVKVYYVDATNIAVGCGSPRSSNIVMLGAFAALNDCLPRIALKNALGKQFAGNKDYDNIVKAYESGVEAVDK